MKVETVRVILERTFLMPVAESDAQIVLDRLNKILSDESRATTDAVDVCTCGHPESKHLFLEDHDECNLCDCGEYKRN